MLSCHLHLLQAELGVQARLEGLGGEVLLGIVGTGLHCGLGGFSGGLSAAFIALLNVLLVLVQAGLEAGDGGLQLLTEFGGELGGTACHGLHVVGVIDLEAFSGSRVDCLAGQAGLHGRAGGLGFGLPALGNLFLLGVIDVYAALAALLALAQVVVEAVCDILDGLGIGADGQETTEEDRQGLHGSGLLC
jgi:hypothetical protein